MNYPSKLSSLVISIQKIFWFSCDKVWLINRCFKATNSLTGSLYHVYIHVVMYFNRLKKKNIINEVTFLEHANSNANSFIVKTGTGMNTINM